MKGKTINKKHEPRVIEYRGCVLILLSLALLSILALSIFIGMRPQTHEFVITIPAASPLPTHMPTATPQPTATPNATIPILESTLAAMVGTVEAIVPVVSANTVSNIMQDEFDKGLVRVGIMITAILMSVLFSIWIANRYQGHNGVAVSHVPIEQRDVAILEAPTHAPIRETVYSPPPEAQRLANIIRRRNLDYENMRQVEIWREVWSEFDNHNRPIPHNVNAGVRHGYMTEALQILATTTSR